VVKVSGETSVSASGAEIIWRTPIISGSVIISGNVGTSVSGNVVSAASGVETIWRGVTVSGSVIISGSVATSGFVQILTGVITINGGVPVTSGSVIVSGSVSVSGFIQVLTGVVTVTNLGIVSGSIIVSGSVIVSGNVGVSGSVSILSGGIVNVVTLTALKINNSGNPMMVTANSGGANLISAAVASVLLKAMVSCSSDVYVGDVTSKPFSGVGFALSPGEAVNVDINQVGTIWVCAANSGDKVTWLGVS
jgi:formylmethanofuran dehydrogenase subunit C